MIRVLTVITMLVGALGVLPAQAADLVVIVHPQVQVDTLSAEQLRRIYKKEITEWPGGTAIVPFDHAGSDDVRKIFCNKVLGATVSEVQNFWINKRMTAGLSGPRVFKSATLVKKFVANTPGGIGYIKPEQVDDSVKVIAVEGL